MWTTKAYAGSRIKKIICKYNFMIIRSISSPMWSVPDPFTCQVVVKVKTLVQHLNLFMETDQLYQHIAKLGSHLNEICYPEKIDSFL